MDQQLQVTTNEYLPLRDVVFKTLRQGILMGDLAPGQRLMEIQLANQLGVSRTPIREAMRMLELEGLVVMIPRKGAQVAKISQKGLYDVLEVRSALEDLAMELSCKRITEEELAQLRNAIENFKMAVKKKDITQIAEQDVALHDIIYAATKNDRLIALLSNLREQMYRYRMEYLKNFSVHQDIIDEHEALYTALSTRDVAVAKSTIHSHIYNQVKTVSRSLEEE